MADVFATADQKLGIGIIDDAQNSIDREDILGRMPRPLWFTPHVGTTVQSRFESLQSIGVDVTRCNRLAGIA